jgi:hypothetical protein
MHHVNILEVNGESYGLIKANHDRPNLTHLDVGLTASPP